MAPGINGRETHREIIKKHPSQKVIIVSGFSESDDVRSAIRLGANGFIQKPYTLNTIGRAVLEAFNS
jgi:two-component system, cell cycle sensor histidine kinase and response regulator CckA